MKYFALLFLLASAGAVRADASNFDVLQANQTFEPRDLQIPAGAGVSFLNGDDVTHNIHATGPDGAVVDHGLQKPGETTHFDFAAKGVYAISCAIHPRMKMKITVN